MLPFMGVTFATAREGGSKPAKNDSRGDTPMDKRPDKHRQAPERSSGLRVALT
jgi:hypothetical protein